jgi:uncharacterized RDD family membrane protein YckC
VRADAARTLELVTPEGVALPFEIASAVDRVAALALDLFLVHVVVAALSGLAALSAVTDAGSVAASVALLAGFLLRSFYFTYFEIRRGGSTPGKRRLGLRVISRQSGALGAEAVFARNLTREIEVFVPLTVVLAPRALLPELPGWAALAGSAWLLLFGVLPLLNRERLRVGDLVGGTVVVCMPAATLLEDLAAARGDAAVEPAARPAHVFTTAQLDLYGIRELQLLEDLLRRPESAVPSHLLEAVAARIKRKMRWPKEARPSDPRRFLEDFYAAQRARLEHKMLFGVRQERKKDTTKEVT